MLLIIDFLIQIVSLIKTKGSICVIFEVRNASLRLIQHWLNEVLMNNFHKNCSMLKLTIDQWLVLEICSDLINLRSLLFISKIFLRSPFFRLTSVEQKSTFPYGMFLSVDKFLEGIRKFITVTRCFGHNFTNVLEPVLLFAH